MFGRKRKMAKRTSGILLPIFSLPSEYGIGDLGPWAHWFVDFLHEALQTHWQVLPVHPTDPISGNSPYSSISVMAGNPLFISPELLLREGLIHEEDTVLEEPFPRDRCDYQRVIPWKRKVLEKAFGKVRGGHPLREDFKNFCDREAHWLEDYALFVSIKRKQGGSPWTAWPEDVKWRDPSSLERERKELEEEMEKEMFFQFLFFRQWKELKERCEGKGIELIGDVPIYVNHDSVDVWRRPDLFHLDQEGNPEVVAGVPPDYFSATGQRWGNPIYRWDRIAQEGFEWWIERLDQNFRLFHRLRIDHFRGFFGYWEIPAAEETAVNGRWVQGPGEKFLERILEKYSRDSIIAEDLGIITEDVRSGLERLRIPGMRVLQFGFSGEFPRNCHLPHNYVPNCVAYTGTHDNNTLLGWWENEAPGEEKERVFSYLGRKPSPRELPWEMVRLVMMSGANTVIFPLQDILCLGEEARINRPSVAHGNWMWRLEREHLEAFHGEFLKRTTWIYGRAREEIGDISQGKGELLVEICEGRRLPLSKRWPREPVIYEINTMAWLWELSRRWNERVTLCNVPQEEWDKFWEMGIDAVWLMGVWERSPKSALLAMRDPAISAECQRVLENFSPEDVVGSPYSVRSYQVDETLGGLEGLAIAREMLGQRGIKLVLDYVPNHVAHDNPWVEEHPDFFIQGDEGDLLRDPDGFVRIGERIFACGKDPFFPPWKDTVQVNCFHEGFREASLELVRKVADMCDGIRCDMAMLLLNRVFKRTWSERVSDPPADEFWTHLISGLRRTHPRVMLIAEAYWGLEQELMELGFDASYDKVLRDRLLYDGAWSVTEHLQRTSSLAHRLVRFLENHDEERAASAFEGGRHRAAAFVMAFVPGIRLYHHGQWEGRRHKVPIQLRRPPEEPIQEEIRDFYTELLALRRTLSGALKNWSLCPVEGWPENQSFRNIIAWNWGERGERYLAVVNFSDQRSQALVRLELRQMGEGRIKLQDLIGGETYLRSAASVRGQGLYVDLGPWGIHLFQLSPAQR